jgi:hypothetical protein
MYGLLPVFLGGLFLGRLAGMWNKVIDRPICNGKTLVYGLGIMILFVSVRSMQDFVIMCYGLLGWLVIARIIMNRSRKGGTVPLKGYAALPTQHTDS